MHRIGDELERRSARARRRRCSSHRAPDAHRERLLALSLAVPGWSDALLRASAIGGARLRARRRLSWSRSGSSRRRPGPALPCSALKAHETLRERPREPDGELCIEVEEVVHCAKALIRSALWSGGAGAAAERPLRAAGAGPLADPMAVRDKIPKLALLLRVEQCRLAESPALADSGLWEASRRLPAEALPSMARVLADHVKQNKRRGVAAAALRSLVSERTLGPAWSGHEKGLY
jgi:hypothetical protein